MKKVRNMPKYLLDQVQAIRPILVRFQIKKIILLVKVWKAGQYYPGRMTSQYPEGDYQPNFELVNENSEYPQRQISSNPPFQFPEEKPSVAHSLPLSLAQFEKRNSHSPQYITQHSMV